MRRASTADGGDHSDNSSGAPRAENPSVSVVIPARDSERTICETLDSIDRQTCRVAEVIVVDDRSSDQTIRTIEQYSDASSLRIRTVDGGGYGAGAARNKGARVAEGQLVAFVDADDRWYPNKLAQQLKLVNADVALVGAIFDYVTPAGRIIGNSDRGLTWTGATDALAQGKLLPVPTSSFVIDRDLFHSVGGFDVQFRRAQDLEFGTRIARHGMIVWPERDPLLAYTISSGSVTANSYREQFRAAELIRRRLSGKACSLSYEEAIASPQWMTRARRREENAGVHYRRAAIEFGAGERFASVGSLVKAIYSSPVATSRKLIWQSAVRSLFQSRNSPI